jgi:alpha-L-fucosidase 2
MSLSFIPMKGLRLCVVFLIGVLAVQICSAGEMTLWYRTSAHDGMNEALPIGNGRMGGLIYGAPEEERININEDGFWTGDANPSGDYGTMGSYQTFGVVAIQLPTHTNVLNYRRDLNIETAISTVGYEIGGVKYKREIFCSHPAGVLMARFTADKPRSYSGRVELRDSHGTPVMVSIGGLSAAGALNNGLKYEWQARVLPDGGSVKKDGNALVFSGCDGLTLLIAAGTDYAMDYSRSHRGEDPHQRLTASLNAASETPYATLERDHEADYRSLFDRVAIDLGTSSETQRALPTDERRV